VRHKQGVSIKAKDLIEGDTFSDEHGTMTVLSTRESLEDMHIIVLRPDCTYECVEYKKNAELNIERKVD